MQVNGEELEQNGLRTAAELIAIAARTAPKGKGVDNLVTSVVSEENLERLREQMYNIADREGSIADFFKRDADNLKKSPYVVLFGTKVSRLDVHPCGFCGYNNCQENHRDNGICAFNPGDLGIAIGSAVSKAADLRVDNRVMFTVGKAALELKLLGDDVKIAYGLPLFSGGKSIYFDR
ncbi:ferredoxin domain-containing protein [Natranaerobius thermophilus]|uniref:Conserved ferredoxin domain protein n=1 Tax=Natranaerobius thermophilus (strain ATCC BAA-1301 / DSM 18059 / JW/NM-WN-LF) TaxID=457570 RepID=B2A440_NATTJ|nr:DUF2148 domain-containing protein [Natranaerobius thermophilus]ACB86446.1 conserved ferredoxin domain protein [Natranaerobius thermophilus JW/NM-WN-LF]